jgi:hypothetical protein
MILTRKAVIPQAKKERYFCSCKLKEKFAGIVKVNWRDTTGELYNCNNHNRS